MFHGNDAALRVAAWKISTSKASLLRMRGRGSRRISASVLIDVRTIAEWAYVGLPDLNGIGKRPILVEWQGFPGDQLNSAFVERLSEALSEIGANKDCELLFICRSGSRSQKAARAMAAAGYRRCRNHLPGPLLIGEGSKNRWSCAACWGRPKSDFQFNSQRRFRPNRQGDSLSKRSTEMSEGTMELLIIC